MKSLLTRPKYDGYKIKCGTCRCRFFVPFEDVRTSGFWGDERYVSCPHCHRKIEYSFFWKKHSAQGGDNE